MVNLEEWINKEIERLDISEAELCRRAGIKQSVVANAKERNGVGDDIARRLAEGVGRRQDEVFYELGLLTEKPGDVIIKDEVLRDIWNLVGTMTPDEKIAFRVFARQMTGRAGDEGRGYVRPGTSYIRK